METNTKLYVKHNLRIQYAWVPPQTCETNLLGQDKAKPQAGAKVHAQDCPVKPSLPVPNPTWGLLRSAVANPYPNLTINLLVVTS